MAINKEDYLYISSLLRAREPRMLNRDRAERMLDAPNVEDAAKMLTDSGYEDMSQMTVKQIENALSDRRAAVFHELESLVPNTAALDLFRLKYDYHNAKVLIKSEAMHRDDASLLSKSGRIAVEVMQKRFQEDRLRDLPGRLYDADVVIVSKCPPYMEEADKVAFAKTLKFKSFDPVTCVAEASRGRRVTLLFSSIRYEQRQPVFESTDPHYLYAQQTLLFSGIANDAPLVNYLSDKHNVVWHHSFPDHHKYTRGDISTILAAVKKHPTASVVTTEKDAQRVLDYKEMPSKLAERTFMVPISVDFITEEEKLIFKNIITGI